jgi:D123
MDTRGDQGPAVRDDFALERRFDSHARWKLEISSEHRLRSENLAFDIDSWYPLVKDHTYPTLFLPLRRREAQAVCRFYRQLHGLRRDRELGPADVAAIEGIEKRLGRALEEHPEMFGQHGAFLRLCGRSPKDADALDRSGVWKQYLEQLATIVDRDDDEEGMGELDLDAIDANTKLLAIARTTSVLRVQSAEEAMSLVLTSERVYTDLLDWIHYGEPEQIVLRSFDPELSMEFEFRAFVCQNRLTAISQYDHYGVYDDLLAPLMEEIQDAITEKWEEVHPLVGEPSYCMEFGFIRGRGAVLIEMSPFLRCTGPALFRWDDDLELLEGRDESVRSNSEAPFDRTTGRLRRNGIEFRINVFKRTNLDEVQLS